MREMKENGWGTQLKLCYFFQSGDKGKRSFKHNLDYLGQRNMFMLHSHCPIENDT